MLTLLLGPFLAVLPKRWREALPFRESIVWRLASILSGLGEGALALVAILYWYSYSMTSWVSRALDAALAGKMGPNVTDHDIGITALLIFATHPLTWVIAYVGVEGAVRLLGAAFTETNLGILPLFVLDKILLTLTGRTGPTAAQAAGYTEGNFSSYVGAIREKVNSARGGALPDELHVIKEATEEFLEIRSSRRKPDWIPPRTVRYLDTFYRLESCHSGSSPRPFRYRLRRLSAGVMGRTVLVYSPQDAPVLAQK